MGEGRATDVTGGTGAVADGAALGTACLPEELAADGLQPATERASAMARIQRLLRFMV